MTFDCTTGLMDEVNIDFFIRPISTCTTHENFWVSHDPSHG